MARQTEIQYVHFYTEGSAAPKVAPAFQEDPFYVPVVQRRRRKRVCWDPFMVMGFVTALTLFGLMIAGMLQIQSVQAQNQEMEQYLMHLEQEHTRLSGEFEDGYNLDVVKKTAEALGMVPAEQAPVTRISVKLPEPAPMEKPTVWSKAADFLTGIFS